MLGSLLEGRVVAMGTDEPFAHKVGGKTGLSALGETAGLVGYPLYPRMLFRNCTELSSRGFRHALGPDKGNTGVFVTSLSLLVRLAQFVKVILSLL